MQEIRYVITDDAGIHARPAGLLVKEAARFQSDIKVQKGEKQADAKRLFAIMSLAAKKGDELRVQIEGSDEAEAVQALKDFLTLNL